jgi:hypothetical integral membrane protein (TIGR02206 family)
MGTPLAYWLAVAIGAVICAALCIGARRRPGPWVTWAARAISVVLVADAITFVTTPLVDGTWSARTSVPIDLCDVALVVAAVACWRPKWQLAVELTYFWGLAGTLQAVSTPDLSAGFPHVTFFEFVVGHLGIVMAALFLVIGLRCVPRPGSVVRVFAITVAYTAFVGIVDAATGANYMFLRAVPSHTSLLSVLGPWPWYLLSAAGVAAVLLLILDAPFRVIRSRAVPGSGAARPPLIAAARPRGSRAT